MKKELCKHWETFPEDNDYFEREDRRVVVDMIIADRINTLVEFACGTGITPKMLRDKGWWGAYVGTDITENFIEASQEHNADETFFYADLDEPLKFKDKEFEGICIFTGLGYCQDIEKTLTELKRICSRYIYLDMPKMLIEGETDLRFLKGEGWGNQYNKKEFFEILKRVGFKEEIGFTVINDLDYWAKPDVLTSKENYILKLSV